METAGSPTFLGNPLCSCPALRPRQDRRIRPTRCVDAAPAMSTAKAPAWQLSRLNHTASALAVYASQAGSPRHHARLASGCWPSSSGRDCLPAGFQQKVSRCILHLSLLFQVLVARTSLIVFFRGAPISVMSPFPVPTVPIVARSTNPTADPPPVLYGSVPSRRSEFPSGGFVRHGGVPELGARFQPRASLAFRNSIGRPLSPSSSPAIKTPMKTAVSPPIAKFSGGEDGRSGAVP